MDRFEVKLERPLFYNNTYGLRFEVGPKNLDIWADEGNTALNEEYFNVALIRASEIFNAAFASTDDISISYQIPSDGRKKIKKRNFIFKQISNLKSRVVEYSEHKDIYPENIDYKRECWRRVTVSGIKTSDVNVKAIFHSLINIDFPPRVPRISGECYLINLTKGLVLNLYDDRGMDVISIKKEPLLKLYQSHNEMLLDYDRDRIDEVFS